MGHFLWLCNKLPEVRFRAGLDSNPILNTGALFTWNASWSMSPKLQGPHASPTHLELQLATHTARIQPSTRGQTVLHRVGGWWPQRWMMMIMMIMMHWHHHQSPSLIHYPHPHPHHRHHHHGPHHLWSSADLSIQILTQERPWIHSWAFTD